MAARHIGQGSQLEKISQASRRKLPIVVQAARIHHPPPAQQLQPRLAGLAHLRVRDRFGALTAQRGQGRFEAGRGQHVLGGSGAFQCLFHLGQDGNGLLRLVAFEADNERYHFLLREENTWQVLSQDDLLRERPFQQPPVSLFMTPPTTENTSPLRIIFGREPVDKPFVLTLSNGEVSAAIRADGVGHFVVE